MLKNAYLVAKISADTAEKEQRFASIFADPTPFCRWCGIDRADRAVRGESGGSRSGSRGATSTGGLTSARNSDLNQFKIQIKNSRKFNAEFGRAENQKK